MVSAGGNALDEPALGAGLGLRFRPRGVSVTNSEIAAMCGTEAPGSPGAALTSLNWWLALQGWPPFFGLKVRPSVTAPASPSALDKRNNGAGDEQEVGDFLQNFGAVYEC